MHKQKPDPPTVYIQCGFGSALDDVFCDQTTSRFVQLPPLPESILVQLEYARRQLASGRARRGRQVQTLTSTIGDAIQAVNDYSELRGSTIVGANPLLALLRLAWKIERSINGKNEPFEYPGRFIPGSGWPVSYLNDLVSIFATLRVAVNSIWELFGCTAACTGAPILFAGPLHDGGSFVDVVGWKSGATTNQPDGDCEVPDVFDWMAYLDWRDESIGEGHAVGGEPAAAGDGRRKFYDRDHAWLFKADEGLKPSEIRDWWNALSDDARRELAPQTPEKLPKEGWDKVRKAIQKARRELQSETKY